MTPGTCAFPPVPPFSSTTRSSISTTVWDDCGLIALPAGDACSAGARSRGAAGVARGERVARRPDGAPEELRRDEAAAVRDRGEGGRDLDRRDRDALTEA